MASAPATVPLALPDLTLTLTTDRGVFSGTRVDAGTKFLLLEAPAPPEGSVDLLDLGCGYGPIAVTLARRAPKARVWAVDVNDRALSLCTANAAEAGVGDRVRAVHPDEVPDEVRFAAIWSNPPIRIGKPALHELLRHWLPGSTRVGRRCSWSRSTSAPTRWPAGSTARGGRPVASPAGLATASWPPLPRGPIPPPHRR